MKTALVTVIAVVFTSAAFTTTASAQNNVFVDLNATWNGFMAVFDNAGGPVGSKGGAQFTSSWGVPDIKTTIDLGANKLTLQPNFNTYADNPGDSFWRDNGGAGPGGNKWMEAATYIQDLAYGGGSLTFSGSINSSTMLSPNYTVSAFIKSFDAGWGWIGWSQDFITNGATDFSVTFNAPAGIVQYGFQVDGLNANPVDEVAFGSVEIQGVPEPSTYAMLALGAAGLGAHMIRRRRR